MNNEETVKILSGIKDIYQLTTTQDIAISDAIMHMTNIDFVPYSKLIARLNGIRDGIVNRERRQAFDTVTEILSEIWDMTDDKNRWKL